LFCKVNKKSICFHKKKETFLEVSSISLKTFYGKPIMLKKAHEASLPKKRTLSEVEGQQVFHLVSFGQDENLAISGCFL
jgi:hypothetical protein